MLTRAILTLAFTGLALTSTAKADTYSHIDGLALRLQQYARLLDREFAAHYRHTSQYRHLRSDSAQMLRSAAHIHEVAHEHGSLQHLRSDLKQLDRLFHHVEELVDEIEHDALHGHDLHGHDFHGHGFPGHGGFGGHIHGNTRHVRKILRAMEDTLHHLRADVEELAKLEDHHHHHLGIPERDYRGPQIRYVRPGFSIWLGR